MKIAVMQPYFLPYLGYWQLIQSVDRFILLDDVQFIRHGWIDRNRIFCPNLDGWQYIRVTVERKKQQSLIRDVKPRDDLWKAKLFAQLNHYRRYTKYFAESRELIQENLEGLETGSIATLNYSLLKNFSKALGIQTSIELASNIDLDYSSVSDSGDWALEISHQLNASTYINPRGGEALFSKQKFLERGISLQFIETPQFRTTSNQGHPINLSILDNFMMLGSAKTRDLVTSAEIKD